MTHPTSKKQVSAIEAFKVLIEEIDATGVFLDRPGDAVKFIAQCVSSALTKLIQREAPEFEPSADWKRANERTKNHQYGCDCSDCKLLRSESPAATLPVASQANLGCPFCGGIVDPAGWLNGDGERGPECETCGATAASLLRWNTRVAVETSGCTRSHPHELMSAECELRTEIARLTNQLARWESPDNWGAFVELLGLPRDHVNKPLGVAAAIALLNSKLDRYMKALQTANGFLIMNNLEPVKLDYSSEKTTTPTDIDKLPCDRCGKPMDEHLQPGLLCP